jgi:acetyltransferase-like isoleucine patch superfamily enzyme
MQVGSVVIGNGCWIGARAVILRNVEIGDGAIVAAGAVVTRSVRPHATVAGVPAREIARREPPGGAQADERADARAPVSLEMPS